MDASMTLDRVAGKILRSALRGIVVIARATALHPPGQPQPGRPGAHEQECGRFGRGEACLHKPHVEPGDVYLLKACGRNQEAPEASTGGVRWMEGVVKAVGGTFLEAQESSRNDDLIEFR